MHAVVVNTLFVGLIPQRAVEDAMVESLRLSLTITCAIILLLQNPTANKAKYRSLG